MAGGSPLFVWNSTSLYHSFNSGDTWVQLPISPVLAFGATWNQNLYVSNSGSKLQWSYDYGGTWRSITTLGRYTGAVPHFLSFDDPYFMVVQRYDSAGGGSIVPSDLFFALSPAHDADGSGNFVQEWRPAVMPLLPGNPPVAPAIISVTRLGPRVVLAASASQLFVSGDTARTFAATPNVPGATISSVFVVPALSMVCLVTDAGIFASSDTGKTWIERNTGLSNRNVLSFSTTQGGEFLAATPAGVFFSKDNGLTWSSRGLSQLRITTLVAYDTLTFFVNSDKGLFFTGDGGTTWDDLNGGLPSTTVSRLAVNPGGYAYAVCGGTLYRTRDMVSHLRVLLESPALPGFFGLDVGNVWVYSAKSTYSGKDQLFAVRKQVADTLANSFRVMSVTSYYSDGSTVPSTEYWYDDGHGRLYESSWTSLSSGDRPLYDLALKRDTTFPGWIYSWGYSYHLLPLTVFGTTLSGQQVLKGTYSKSGAYSEVWGSVPGYAFIMTRHSTMGYGAGADSLGLVGLVKKGVVLGDTALSALSSTFSHSPSGLTSSLTADPPTAPADIKNTITVTMHARDALGNDIKRGGATVWVGSNETQVMNVGWSGPTDHGNGTYSWLFGPSSVPGSATVFGTINGQPLRQTVRITFVAAASPETSTLTASPDSIPADGATACTVTVQLCDVRGIALGQSMGVVTLQTTRGYLSPVTDHGDGTYSALLRSTAEGAAVVSGTLSGEPILQTASVIFTRGTAPLAFVLEPNFPNPFNSVTNIRYGIPSPCHVTLTLFNPTGQKVAEIVNDDMAAGYHDVQFNAGSFASGVYFYRLQAGGSVITKTMTLVK